MPYIKVSRAMDLAAIMRRPEFQFKLRQTKNIFPKVDLIYSATGMFMDDAYVRVVLAYRDPVMTQCLADLFDYLTTSCGRLMWLYVGLGVTDQMRLEYAEFAGRTNNSVRARRTCRVGPNGLHPKILARIAGATPNFMGGKHIPGLFRMWFTQCDQLGVQRDIMVRIIDAYIAGDRQAMWAAIPENIRATLRGSAMCPPQPVCAPVRSSKTGTAASRMLAEYLDEALDCYNKTGSRMKADIMPEKLRRVFDLRCAYKIGDISTDELNRAGRWLYQNFNEKTL